MRLIPQGKVAFTLTPQKLKDLWVIPAGFVVVTSVSMGVAFGLGSALRLKKSQRAFAMAAAGFQNSNSLPIALVQSLVVEVPGLKVRSSSRSPLERVARFLSSPARC